MYIPPKRFYLKREEDPTGISGVWIVASGVQFDDGTCVLRWRSVYASTVVYDDLENVIKIYCHAGKTKIVWIDEE